MYSLNVIYQLLAIALRRGVVQADSYPTPPSRISSSYRTVPVHVGPSGAGQLCSTGKGHAHGVMTDRHSAHLGSMGHGPVFPPRSTV